MDQSFIETRLRGYLAQLSLWLGADDGTMKDAIEREILMLRPTALRLIEACGQRVPRSSTFVPIYVREHQEATLQALGRVRDRQALERALAPDRPHIVADQLHAWVWAMAAPLWDSRHYRQAVAAAAGNLSLKVQAKLDRWHVADDALMTEALSEKPPAPGKPRLRLPATPGRPFEEALQLGAVAYARGVFSLLRNPATNNVREVWDEQRALGALAALSVLARCLDDASVVQAEEAPRG